MMGTRIYVGVGSNWGQPDETVTQAAFQVIQLGQAPKVSSLYWSAPWGGPAQRPYCNAVVACTTAWTPLQVLSILWRLESRFGRCRREPWGPRTLDLDLLLWGQRVIDEPYLVVPHARLQKRRFVLEPLAELEPHLAIVGVGSVSALLARVQDQEVRLWRRP